VTARRVVSLAILASTAAACSNLLGLSQPKEQIDSGAHPGEAGGDSAIDAAPIHPTIHVITTGTAGGTPGTVTSDPPGISCPGTCDFTFDPGATVTLTDVDGSGSPTFPGFYGGGCTGSAGSDRHACTITPTADATVFARYWSPDNIIFVSSTTQTPGSFDSVASADTLCNQLAGSAGLPGKYVSYLSTNERLAALRVQDAQQNFVLKLWVRPDGKLFTASDLEAGTVAFPPRLDERGSDVGDDALAATGTLSGSGSASGDHCSNWASENTTNGLVFAGEPAGGFTRWTHLQGIECNAPAHIYCVGANGTSLLASPPPGAFVIFESSATFPGNAGVSAMDTECAMEASAAGLPNSLNTALVTPGNGKPVASRFSGLFLSGDAERPDSIAVSPGVNGLLLGSAFEAPPDVMANRQPLDADVWIGAGSFGSFANDCSGWTDASPSSLGATRPAGTTRGTGFFNQASCSESHHVLCANYVAAEALH
jgi:hypothetical protein